MENLLDNADSMDGVVDGFFCLGVCLKKGLCGVDCAQCQQAGSICFDGGYGIDHDG